jgi:hypothetical protein
MDHFLVSIFKLLKLNIKLLFLRRITHKNVFNYIHAIELQGAAYLYDLLPEQIQDRTSLIVTNYGSDIQYFQDIPEHQEKIRSVLSKADFYSAECQRDYESALKLGFKGKFLPCIPNAGGFKNEIFELNLVPSNERNLIMAKCYGGTFGLGELIIDALEIFLRNNTDVKIVMYSVTDDLLNKSKNLRVAFPNQVVIYTVREKIPRYQILDYLSKSRIYIGASRSDGISTSFLEALCLGAFPIQTDTSCANEWIELGFFGSIIQPDTSEIFTAINVNYFNKELENKRIQNLESAKRYLSYDLIQSQAIKFYETSK